MDKKELSLEQLEQIGGGNQVSASLEQDGFIKKHPKLDIPLENDVKISMPKHKTQTNQYQLMFQKRKD